MLFALFILIFVAFSILLPGKFFTIRNMQSMAVQFPEFGILAFAIMITMLTGGIDLSIVGTANLAAIVAAMILTRLGGEGAALIVIIPLAMVAAMAVAAFFVSRSSARRLSEPIVRLADASREKNSFPNNGISKGRPSSRIRPVMTTPSPKVRKRWRG